MDRERVLSKLGVLDNYLEELNAIKPDAFEEYAGDIEKKMACERLLHLAIETTIDVCYQLVKELKLGLPASDESVIQKLSVAFSPGLVEKLKGMKRLRNVLVHRYDEIMDEKVFRIIENDLNDFMAFKTETLKLLESKQG